MRLMILKTTLLMNIKVHLVLTKTFQKLLEKFYQKMEDWLDILLSPIVCGATV